MLARLRSSSSLRNSVLKVAKRTYIAPVREMRFMLHEVHEFEKHYETLETETPCDRETIGAPHRANRARHPSLELACSPPVLRARPRPRERAAAPPRAPASFAPPPAALTGRPPPRRGPGGRAHIRPITCHHTEPTPTQIAMLMTLVSAPT